MKITKAQLKQIIQETLEEVLGPDADVGDYVDDFEDSEAPQFKGKSKKKRKEMAIAAALDAKEGEADE